jgi:hypothetical protein
MLANASWLIADGLWFLATIHLLYAISDKPLACPLDVPPYSALESSPLNAEPNLNR